MADGEDIAAGNGATTGAERLRAEAADTLVALAEEGAFEHLLAPDAAEHAQRRDTA